MARLKDPKLYCLELLKEYRQLKPLIDKDHDLQDYERGKDMKTIPWFPERVKRFHHLKQELLKKCKVHLETQEFDEVQYD